MDPYKKPRLIVEDEDEKRRRMLGQNIPYKPEFTPEQQQAVDSTKDALRRPMYEKLMDLFKKGKK
jgi:hypothetical protein